MVKGVDYSTIERDYTSSAGNTLQRDANNEMGSLATSKARTNEAIATRGMTGPGLYRPSPITNEYNSSGSTRSGQMPASDLPNIDIGGYALDAAGAANKKSAAVPNRVQNRVQFPDGIGGGGSARQQSQPNVEPRSRYVASST